MNGADVPLRRLPVHHLPVMLTEHLHGVVGFFGTDRNATGLPGDVRVSPERGRRTVPEVRRLFWRIREGSKRMN
jgi:hypothetical protein